MDKEKLTQIIKEAQSGVHTALETLYREYVKSVYYLALKLLKNKEDAEDITQEVFIYVYQKIGDLQTHEAFTVWLNRIVTNKSTDLLRKKRDYVDIVPEELSESEFFEESDPLLIPEKYVDNAETSRLIVEIIDNLPLPQRLCVYYYYYERLTIAQIAENLASNENTVKTRLSMAREKIRKELERLDKEDGIKLYGIPLMLTPILKADSLKFELPHELINNMHGKVMAAATAKGVITMGIKAKIAIIIGGVMLTGGVVAGVLLATSGNAPPTPVTTPRSSSVTGTNVSITGHSASTTTTQKSGRVEVKLIEQGITDEQLAQMVTSGEIPHNVTHLDLDGNVITDITPLSSLVNLEELQLQHNQIADFPPLGGLTNLSFLCLRDNQISDISTLGKLTDLRSLWLDDNQISDITTLSELTYLNKLILSNNQITDLSPLSGLLNLNWLTLNFNPLSMEQVEALEVDLPDCQIYYWGIY